MTNKTDEVDWSKTSIATESVFSKILQVLKENPRQGFYLIKLILAIIFTLLGAAIYFGSAEGLEKIKAYTERKTNDLTSYWKRWSSNDDGGSG